jgi:hypothetical protein
MSYETALYIPVPEQGIAYKKGRAGRSLPSGMYIEDLAELLAIMQVKCFKDDNVQENKERIVSFLNDIETPSVVAVSVYPDLENLEDAGAATMQLAQFDLDRPVAWLNEVCRNNIAGHKPMVSPVKLAIRTLEKYVRKDLKKPDMYLMVEEKPEHGSAEFLISYYNQGYGYKLFDEGRVRDGYIYMIKDLTADIEQPTTTTTTKTRKRAPTSKGTRTSKRLTIKNELS